MIRIALIILALTGPAIASPEDMLTIKKFRAEHDALKERLMKERRQRSADKYKQPVMPAQTDLISGKP